MPQSISHGKRLDSWKQIADHLQCSERTVRRYQSKGIPVYRVAGLNHQRVFAYADELDRWIHQGGSEVAAQGPPEKDFPGEALLGAAEETGESPETHLRLAPAEGPDSNAGFIVDRPLTVLGRDIHADIVLADPRISRRHACIYRQGEAFFLEDLKSRNGTVLNETTLHGRTLLCHGDRICLGGAVFLRVMLVTTGETVDSDTS